MSATDHFLSGARRVPLGHDDGALPAPPLLVLHYTAGGSVTSSIAVLQQLGLGYHVLIDRDGTVTQTTAFNRRVSHAGQSAWRGNTSVSRMSIAVCFANLGWLNRRAGDGWTRGGLARPVPADRVVVARHRLGGAERGCERYPEAQIAAGLEVVRAILTTYPSIVDVQGHDDVATPPGRKQDPGPAFPLARFQALLPARAA